MRKVHSCRGFPVIYRPVAKIRSFASDMRVDGPRNRLPGITPSVSAVVLAIGQTDEHLHAPVAQHLFRAMTDGGAGEITVNPFAFLKSLVRTRSEFLALQVQRNHLRSPGDIAKELEKIDAALVAIVREVRQVMIKNRLVSETSREFFVALTTMAARLLCDVPEAKITFAPGLQSARLTFRTPQPSRPGRNPLETLFRRTRDNPNSLQGALNSAYERDASFYFGFLGISL